MCCLLLNDRLTAWAIIFTQQASCGQSSLFTACLVHGSAATLHPSRTATQSVP